MVIYLPGQQEPGREPLPSFDELTPREIVVELDKYIIGQNAAKRAVAIALRNRVRRQKLEPELAEEILPKNILMIGPTGVGKTEIARRLARLAGCPRRSDRSSRCSSAGFLPQGRAAASGGGRGCAGRWPRRASRRSAR